MPDPATDTTVAEPVETTGSLADYEAAVHLPAVEGTAPPVTEEADQDEAPPAVETARGADGKFQRHRAASQKAGAEDVETIGALTKRIKDAEAAEGADIARQDGESERVFTLRRRAEILERKKAAKAEPARPAPVVAREPARPVAEPAAPVPEKFPEFASWAGSKPEATYEDYLDARADHREAQRESTRVKQKMQADAATESARVLEAWKTKTEAAKAKYADFQAVALDAPTKIQAGSVPDLFILEDDAGADVLYHLQRHPDELDALLAKPALGQVKMLSLLAQRLTTPTAADSTGAAPRTTSQPAPRPPTPVRGGPSRPTEEPPTADDTPLDVHERAFHKTTRR